MDKFMVAFVIGIVLVNVESIGATPIRKSLADSEGQLLVERFFAGTEFNTGDWGNDISLLLPFQWLSENNEKFTLFSMAEHKRTHEADWFVEQIVDGCLRHRKYKYSLETDIEFLPRELYEIQYSSGKKCLCYHNERTSGSDAATDGVGFIENSIWNELDIGTNGCPQKTVRKGWPEALFADEAFQSVRSVVPLRFRGPKAEKVKEKDKIQERLDEHTATQNGWSLDVTQRELLVTKHFRFVTEEHRSKTVTALYIVACDVNHDGMCDAYVTSNVEGVDGGKYRWALYLRTAAGYSRQKEAIKISVKQTEDLYLEGDVVAAKDAFFRVDRLQMPAYVLVLSELDGHSESWSYMHHANPVRDFRRRNGFAKADYYSCLANGKSGVSSIRDLFLSYYTIVRAERLSCETVNVLGHILQGESSAKRETLSFSDGQAQVERFFDGEEFNTGDWGDEISLLLPFKWNLGVGGYFTLFSMTLDSNGFTPNGENPLLSR